MPGVHPRELLINSEGFWGRFLFVRENEELKQYWRSQAARDASYREGIRELVATLGSLIFEMVIWIS